MGKADDPGHQNKLPCIFFAARDRQIPALRALVDVRAKVDYIWNNKDKTFVREKDHNFSQSKLNFFVFF